jgi:hypothetical protein
MQITARCAYPASSSSWPRAPDRPGHLEHGILIPLVVTETDLELSDGRRLHFYDTGAGDVVERLAVFWHHGTPNIGAPPEPLFAAADQRGIR